MLAGSVGKGDVGTAMATETMVGGGGGVEHGQTPTFRGPMQEEEAPKWAWEGNSERQVDSKKKGEVTAGQRWARRQGH